MLRRLARAIDAVLARSRFERDLRHEFHLHLEQRAADLMATGLSPAEARRVARVEFGPVERYREQCRDERGFAPARLLHGSAADFALAARRLLAAPLFTAFGILSIALGVGVTTAVYSVVESLLWRPLGIADASGVALVTVPDRSSGVRWRAVMSRPDFDELHASAKSFSSLAASAAFQYTVVTPSGSGIVDGEAVTGAYFETLKIGAALGRTLQPADVNPPVPVAVVSHSYWQTALGSDPAVVGQVIRLNGLPLEVVGVIAEGFDGLRDPTFRYSTTAIWVPLVPVQDRRAQLSVVGRLAPAASAPAAAAETATIARGLDASVPLMPSGATDAKPRERQWRVLSIGDATATPEASRVGWLITMIVGLVMVVACTNLSNLILARGTTRCHEIAVRRALGASRWRLVREQCAESLLIALLGGVAALAVTRALLVFMTIDLPAGHGRIIRLDPQLSGTALALTAAALLVSLMVFGLEPALQLTRRTLRGALDSDAGSVGPSRPRRQWALLRAQVAICATFLLIAAILAKVVVVEARHDPGIDLDALAITSVHFKLQGRSEQQARQFLEQTLAMARTSPDIESITVSSGIPLTSMLTPFAAFTTPDKPFPPAEGRARHDGPDGALLTATPEVFATLGVRIVRGRAFNEADTAESGAVAVLSERAARDLFGSRDPIGHEVMVQAWGRPPAKTFTVVGIASDTDTGRLFSRESGSMYVPFAQHYEPNLMLIARARGNPAAAVRVLQASVRAVDDTFGVGAAGPARLMLAAPYILARMATVLTVALGALTLLLAMVGLYGVQTQLVASRTREVGVRMALGASVSQVERMVLREGFRPVVQGLLIGLGLGVAARVVIRSVLAAPIAAVDPVTLALVPIPLVAAAFIACYLPARRAARVDPNAALRHL